MFGIKFKDIKNNSYYFKIILLYTVLLAIVYGYMCFVLCKKSGNGNQVWATILTAGLIVVAGFIIEIIYLRKQAKKSNQEEIKEENK